MMDVDHVWQTALGQLQLQMTRATFDTWVKDTRVVSKDNGKLIVGTKSAFAKDWLENRLSTTINRTVSNVLGHAVDIKYVVDPGTETVPELAPALLMQNVSNFIFAWEMVPLNT